MDQNRFESLNQIKLEESSVVCYSCEEWLTGSIYLGTDKMNYCKPCARKETQRMKINIALGNLLQSLLYYCDYCRKFVAKQIQLLLHKEACKERKIAMTCCNDTISELLIGNHLRTEHTLNEIVMSNNVIYINARKILGKAQFWSATWNNNEFIIRIIQITKYVLVKVAADNPIAGNNTPFIAKSTEQNIRGQVMKYRTMFEKTINTVDNATATLIVPDTDEFDLEIIIGGERNTANVSQCLIGNHALTDKVFLCQNGHMICSDCKPKVDTCGMCREPMGNGFFMLSNLLPGYNNISCPHVTDGCLHVLPADKIEDHVKKCKYNDKVNCDACYEKVAKCNIWQHMKSHHENQIILSIFGRVHYDLEASPKYCLFDNHIIACKTTLISEKIHFNVRVLYASKTKASKYAFKIIDDSNPPNCLAQTFCQAHSDNENCILVNYNDSWQMRILYFKF